MLQGLFGSVLQINQFPKGRGLQDATEVFNGLRNWKAGLWYADYFEFEFNMTVYMIQFTLVVNETDNTFRNGLRC